MLRSLRARLFLVTVAIAGAALVTAALVSRVAVRSEFRHLERDPARPAILQTVFGVGYRLIGTRGVP